MIFFSNLSARNAWEQLQRLAFVAEPQRPQNTFAPEAWDIGSMPIRVRKASYIDRDARDIEYIVGHVVDVRGGFGVQRWGPEGWQHWEKVIREHRIPRGVELQLPAEVMRDTDALARRLALWSRFRNTPYHEVAVANGDILDNRRLGQRSHHAGPGNGGVGFAMDCAHNEQLSTTLVATGRKGFARLVQRLRDAGNTRELRYLPHRAFSKQRHKDTHIEVHRRVIIPAVAACDGVVIDYEHSEAGGLPISTEMDPNALYDSRGRRERTAT